jgi:hypothetical protein
VCARVCAERGRPRSSRGPRRACFGGDHGGREDGVQDTGTIKKKGWAGLRGLLTGRLLAKEFG